mgnify:CR=1 FL=1
MKGYIHSLESFGAVDGPGIRFVVFMQGCPLRCAYCHNPDTWETGKGTEMGTDELIKQYMKNESFYSKGGITVTGGEPLLQIDFITELFKKAKEKGIHTCIDTSGITFNPKDTGKFDELFKYVDLVLLDIKHINGEKHKKIVGADNKNILAFAKYLEKKNIPVWIRHVVVKGLTDKKEDLYALGRFVGGLKNVRAIEVLPYHSMGESKYETLGIPYPLKGTKLLSEEEYQNARKYITEGYKDEHKISRL